jgi:hypothetical protein
MDGDGFWGAGNAGALWAAVGIVVLIGFVFSIYLQWRIFAKAGFPGATALLNLAIFVPVIGILVPLALQAWLAFADWPALRKPQA